MSIRSPESYGERQIRCHYGFFLGNELSGKRQTTARFQSRAGWSIWKRVERLKLWAEKGLRKGAIVAIDSTALKAKAAIRLILQRCSNRGPS